MKKKIILIIISLIIAALLFLTAKKLIGSKDEYVTVPLKKATIIKIIEASGTINPVQTATVGAQVSGKITGVYVDFNSPVTKGQLLAEIDTSLFQASVDQQRASIENSKAQLRRLEATTNYDKLMYQRYSNLLKKGYVSKRRNFYVVSDFLNYLFIENILLEDLSVYVPKIRNKHKRKLPTYLKQDDIEKFLKSISKERKVDIRNYAIILIAARLGLRLSDILNIKFKNIDWKNNKINIIQSKTHNLNILPLSKEVGWAIIDYINKARPKCDNEYLFVKMRYPFEKLEHLTNFNKYFDKCDFEVEDTKKGIHNLRHSFATNMLENDIPIHIISSTLGHSNIDTTASTYIKIDIKNLKKVCLEVEE